MILFFYKTKKKYFNNYDNFFCYHNKRVDTTSIDRVKKKRLNFKSL